METVIYNTLKSRLETIRIEFTEHNTTWFEQSEEADETNSIMAITDYQGCMLISQNKYHRPMLVDSTRAEIGYNREKAKEIMNWWEER
jgi:arsenate reductase-like glutaredoxin family protein